MGVGFVRNRRHDCYVIEPGSPKVSCSRCSSLPDSSETWSCVMRPLRLAYEGRSGSPKRSVPAHPAFSGKDLRMLRICPSKLFLKAEPGAILAKRFAGQPRPRVASADREDGEGGPFCSGRFAGRDRPSHRRLGSSWMPPELDTAFSLHQFPNQRPCCCSAWV